MAGVTLIASIRPSSRNSRVAIFPDCTEIGTSTGYVFNNDSYVVHSFEINESNLPHFINMRTLVFPSLPLEIFTLSSYFCILLEDGWIYKMPETTAFPKSSQSQGCSPMKHPWPEASLIPESCRLFKKKNCVSVCSLRELTCMLFANRLNWSVNIYKFDISATKEHILRPVNNVDLPHMMKKLPDRHKLIPCMTSFVLGDGIDENELDSQLCQCIFGNKLPLDCLGVVLVSLGDGEVFFVSVGTDYLDDVRAFPLFCFNEPIVKMQKVLVKTDPADITKSETGILFVGISGKMIILSRSSNKMQDTGPIITEFHIPGPVYLWSGSGEIAFHTDGSSLWKTTFEKQACLDDGASIISHSTNERAKACGICLFRIQDRRPNILIFTESGNLLLVKNCDKSTLIPPEFCSTSEPLELKELLNTIHECSEQLSKIHQHQETNRMVLNELSSAAHLILNDKVRNKFTVSVIPVWTSAECNRITITITLANEGDFSIVGNHWHFVCTITTASGRCLSKSISLNGFEAGHKVDSTIKVKVADIVVDNDLPFAITSGLQLFLEVVAPKAICPHLENTGYQPPVSFNVKLSTSFLDELNFFSTNIDARSTHCDPSISNALWEIARSRPAMAFHDLECISQLPTTPLENSVFNFVTVKRSFVEKLLKKKRCTEGPLASSFLAYIVSDSKIEMPNDIVDAELSIFGQRVKLIISDDEINIQIKVIVWCPSLLPKLRFAILRKLKFINDSNSDAIKSKQRQIEGCVLRSTVLNSCQSLVSRLLPLSSLQKECRSNVVSHTYAEMRELVSSELPFV